MNGSWDLASPADFEKADDITTSLEKERSSNAVPNL